MLCSLFLVLMLPMAAAPVCSVLGFNAAPAYHAAGSGSHCVSFRSVILSGVVVSMIMQLLRCCMFKASRLHLRSSN